jgi:hypothetical protein
VAGVALRGITISSAVSGRYMKDPGETFGADIVSKLPRPGANLCSVPNFNPVVSRGIITMDILLGDPVTFFDKRRYDVSFGT